MKKTLLVTQMFPPILGGGPNYYFQLCQNLPADKIVVLAHKTPASENDLSGLTAKFKVYYHEFFFRSKLIWPKWLRLVLHLNSIIQRERPEVLWTGEVIPAGTVTWLMSKLHGLPYFVSTHGADVLNPQLKPGLKGKWKKYLVKFVLQNADFVTANSAYTRLQLSKLGLPIEKTLIIYPCPVYTADKSEDAAVDKSLMKQISSLQKKGYKILLTVVGHLVKRKGIDSVINALPKVSLDQKVAYIVTGAGPYKKYLERLIVQVTQSAQKKPIIILTGPVGQAELNYLYSKCDVFIMLPRIEQGLVEGFGIVYLEAGLYSKPVIGAKVGGVPEAIQEFYDDNIEATGLLVDNPRKAGQVAKKILMLLNDDGLRKRLGANGKVWAKRFDWKKEAEKLRERIGSIE